MRESIRKDGHGGPRKLLEVNGPKFGVFFLRNESAG